MAQKLLEFQRLKHCKLPLKILEILKNFPGTYAFRPQYYDTPRTLGGYALIF